MKINKSLLGIVAAAALSACSSDNDLGWNNAGNTDVETPVEIKLASGSKTRGSVESTPEGLFEADRIGLFCLAADYLKINPDETGISWMPAADKNPNYAIVIDNDTINARKNADQTGVDLLWTDAAKHVYYPTGNWYRNQFYAYYPWVNEVDATESQRVAHFTADGTVDIMWGKTYPTNEEIAAGAYSAKFFRNPAYVSQTPCLNFKHKMMRLMFTFTGGEDVEGSGVYAKCLNMGVESIEVLQVPTEGTLVIADRNEPANEGVLTFNWGTTAPKSDIALLDAGDKSLGTEYWVTMGEDNKPEVKQIGQGILLPVPETADYVYKIRIVLKDMNGQLYTTEHPLQLIKSEGLPMAYEAGKSYTVPVVINGTKLVQLSAKLSPWVDGDDPVHDIIL